MTAFNDVFYLLLCSKIHNLPQNPPEPHWEKVGGDGVFPVGRGTPPFHTPFRRFVPHIWTRVDATAAGYCGWTKKQSDRGTEKEREMGVIMCLRVIVSCIHLLLVIRSYLIRRLGFTSYFVIYTHNLQTRLVYCT